MQLFVWAQVHQIVFNGILGTFPNKGIVFCIHSRLYETIALPLNGIQEQDEFSVWFLAFCRDVLYRGTERRLNVRDLAATLENRKQFVLGSKLG
jgi:hypothetical protein